jgi:hypothetical protein
MKVMAGNFVVKWTVTTILSLLAGAAAGFAFGQLFFCMHIVVMEVVGAIFLGCFVGLSVGIAQSRLLEQVINLPKLWLIACVAGWVIAVFLVEINWPISSCLASSNAPRYVPGNLIKSLHDPVFIIAGMVEKELTGEIVYGVIYNRSVLLFMGAMMGIILGLPQGVGQWLVLKKEMPRSSMLVWVNVIAWSSAFWFIGIGGSLLKALGAFGMLILITIAMIPPAVGPALLLASMQKKQTL